MRPAQREARGTVDARIGGHMGREALCHLSVHLTAFDRVTGQRPSAETARRQNNPSNTGYLSQNGILSGMVTCLAGEIWRAFPGSGAV